MSTSLEPNADQLAAFSDFMRFLFSEESEMNISGPGGTGKTYSMGYMIDNTIPQYHAACRILGVAPKYHDVMMTATTNKAAEELAIATGRPCTTIHTFLKLVVKPNFKTGGSDLVRTASWELVKNLIIFVDESSMVSKDLLKQIRETCEDCKIVFIGDHCQLNPVKEGMSPVYTANNKTSHLTIQERAKNQPELVNLFSQLRLNVETNEYKPIQLVPGIIDRVTEEEFVAEIDKHFANPNHSAKILAYTNQQVEAYNDHIRELRKLPPEFVKGELVVNPDVTKLRSTTLHSDKEYIITDVQSDVLVKEFPENGALEYRLYQLESKLGEIINEVPVPVNRSHRSDLLSFYEAYGKRTGDWAPKFWLKDSIAALRQRDASTIHKAQGSTKSTVYVDLNDLGVCRDERELARLLYVGASRASDRVVFFGNLPRKYGLKFVS